MRNKVEITGINTATLKVMPQDVVLEKIKEAQNGSLSARDEVVEGNLKLVLSVIKKFHNRGENLDDLFQVGCIGLMKAIDNFDLSHNVRFSTYACPMIIGEVRRYLRDNGSIRVSRSYRDIAYKAISFKDNFIIEHQREPSINEISEYLNVDSVDVVLALEAIQDTVSMSTPIYDNGGDVIELEDQIGGNDYITENWVRSNMIKEAFSKLSEREKDIIQKRYYLDKTQVEIAEELNISQAQVSRLEKNALKTMYDCMK